MAARFRILRGAAGKDPSAQAADALAMVAPDISRLIEDGLMRSSSGRSAVSADVVEGSEGASLVLTARHRELATAAEGAKDSIARLLRTAWLSAGGHSRSTGG
jgi:hypothetical protein